MTLFDKIYELTKKLSKALLKDMGFRDLDESDLFSEDAKNHIKQHLSEAEIKEHLELLNQIDKEKGWKQVENGISHYGKSKPKNRLSISPFYKIAAVVVLLISLSYITFNGHTNDSLLDQKQFNITVGTDKAILTLENGINVVLEKGKSYQSGIVQGNGERLEYSKTKGNYKTAFNYLTIPRGGQYQIILSDSTIVWLNADTKLKYPVNFVEGEPRNVELVYGEAYFEVSPSTKHQGSVFKVVTKMQEVEVIGTEFNIMAYNDEEHIYTTLVEGHVNVVVDNKKQQLRPGEQSILSTNSKDITKKQVNVDYDIAWIRGYFNFKEKPLKDIMKVLSRWYDVDISFAAHDLEKIKFSGLLNRKQNIEDILNGIKSTKFINAYEIKNKTITIK
ncbi:FecR family protein [Subsaxibacter sp. CAU 1640]|uniref:FecR family protein n=1 Tax=Subsaxibacter sp. CAU 1640 TaxID=2933271 RepID=UPI0020068061|nr:FecR family protein [Subsaxibacter sp. CAU 1640]MCK7591274.1 FecR family protein [Subsaxibacter sp. CAU 1640]